ncbi:MAG TPA: PH domain-containing protein [Thermomonas sp.]|nr:PH domain-containing protein [Thermomonas sp.]
MTTPQARSFAVVPPPAHAWWIMGVLLLLPAVAVSAMFFVRGESHGPDAFAGAAIALTVIALASIACAAGLKRRRVRLEGQVLHVVAGMFSQHVPADRIDLERARIVNLEERTELRPSIKTFGMSLPGYQAGHFRLRGKLGKAFCLVTDRRRVLWLPQREGKGELLVSLEHPQALLDALKATRG